MFDFEREEADIKPPILLTGIVRLPLSEICHTSILFCVNSTSRNAVFPTESKDIHVSSAL